MSAPAAFTLPEGRSHFTNADAVVEQTIAHVGSRIVLGLPLALGKANHLANAFYQRAKADASIDLTIYTALTLQAPRAPNALAARLLDPISQRLYEGYPELDYARDRSRNALPDNVTVKEFFLPPGSLLNNAYAQRNYVSSNYTMAARDILDAGLNVIAQMVAPEPGGKGFSLSCNPDLSLDLVPELRRRAARGDNVAILGEINASLPFLGHEARVERDWFDAIYDAGRYTLFPVPAPSVSAADHAIGLNAASLMRDGGTLQLGIGALSDAVSHALRLRESENAVFKRILLALQSPQDRAVRDRLGGVEPFATGLYACSEMVTDGLLTLFEDGVVRRQAENGISLHGGFYLGPARLYERLRDLEPELREALSMTRISFINDLFGDEAQSRRDRRDARFFNSAMRVNGRGAALSDTLEDGRVVSGVGGQYNFAAMGHALEDGRSVILVRATRSSGGAVQSNIVWTGGEVTVPRHLRDIVVTEYGIADLRGQTDREVAVRLARICDSRFQDEFLDAARAAGKVEPGFTLPDEARQNTPDRVKAALKTAREAGHLPDYPFGSDLTGEEQALKLALEWLKERTATKLDRARTVARAAKYWNPPNGLRSCLKRMKLDRVSGPGEKIEQMLISLAVTETRKAD
ncbi:acetyl-CoA hydrolase [Marinicauda pacifica]|uniref:Acetyl-CoA hydrolase n=1 Tax=Marinicauda pacifica TaxID=1133559 RepID=A0A4S2HCI1_9PROT|nr:acetyl-CoA hydrolase/transferase C-terminal domain-containing protein [Marinicauda pacifica]TGY93172.1 acetyl-CoA hydrolase [Marinicauda pacifica]GGE43481.1 acetyl-CoA hydrolase [Marinicauda pacifica]